MGSRIPIVLCIDCEPDLRACPLDDPSPWHGFERFIAGADALRDRLARATGTDARLTWGLRMDPQVTTLYGSPTWPVERYESFFASVARAGETVGIHPHALRWEGPTRGWVCDHTSDDWVGHCVETSYDAFEEAFGAPPVLHSLGSFYMSTAVMNTVRRRGSRYELTVAPGEAALRPGVDLGVEFLGTGPDHEDVPRVPYRPSTADWRRPAPAHDDAADAPFLAVPLTSGTFVPAPVLRSLPDLRRTADALKARAGRHAGTVRRALAGRRPRPPYEVIVMWREWRSPADFWDAAFAAADELESPYLVFTIRSDTPIDAGLRAMFEGILDHLDRDPRAGRLAFTTPDDAFGPLLRAA